MKKQSISVIKKMIRDTKRLINHSPSPALESKLADLTEKLSDLTSEARKLKIQQKYKYVKFVEKKKLLRKLKSLEKDSDASDVSQVRLHIAYIDHYPTDLKYISILMNTSDEAQEKKNSILLYLQKVKDETGRWPTDWEYASKVLGKTKEPKQLNDDFFI
jgi:hypothetical protein